MPISSLLNRVCTLVYRTEDGTPDAFGNPTIDITAVAAVCEVQQRQRDERTVAGEVATTYWAVYLPADTTVDDLAAVIVDGDVYELLGPPWPARNPRTQTVSHVEATAVRSAGSETPS